ncbi:MbnP family protein [Phaeocystidibacter luteus]|uniref:T9SS type A sorting domain-containing protein n=1 Tax=Phaeocystidibacter luteus TaxID=911197 RepID=A0A6N6RGJ2_9FLAO|nr:MbnP family protein [Phaeocystidibacter luteus]KAB2807683.1 T9SS type A sorting domain-containing protein [Phaeocystidibacter luteus]
MKKALLLIISLISTSLVAQMDVYFRVMHNWDGQPFAVNSPAVTQDGDNLQLDRLQYYISGIELHHDGGQTTALPTTYILADARTTTQVNLGNHAITTLDSISFSIGVDQNANHADPAGYNASHPLAPKSPSMHWGWSAGYRFVAVEGGAGSNLSNNMEIHALGDQNYFSQTVVTNGADMGGYLVIQLDAEYLNSFSGISVNNGLINHGETGAAVKLMENFRDSVFTPSQATVNPVGLDEYTVSALELKPNPTSQGYSLLTLEEMMTGELTITDLTGKCIYSTSVENQGEVLVYIENTGMYIVTVQTDSSVSTSKLQVN